MAKDYRPVDRDQTFLLPPSMLDWLPADHLVWFIIEAVRRLDTTAFHVRAKLGGVGRRGYDPDMLLTLWIYAMAHGERSSRKIETRCHTDVAFRVICAGDTPDHTVLARFRKDHEQALTDLLTRVLELCAELGMVRLGVIAFDGTKIAGNASLAANRSLGHLRQLAEAQLAAAAATDAAEDDLFGPGVSGDQLPEKVRDRTGRGRRIQEALTQVEAKAAAEAAATAEQAAAAEQYVTDLANPQGAPMGRPWKAADPIDAARARWERERARAQQRYHRWQQATERAHTQGRKLTGPRALPPDQHSRVRRARAVLDQALATAETTTGSGGGDHNGGQTANQPKANLTDPDSRILKTRNGWVQGYNCQTGISDDELLLHARATQDANDVEQFQPTAEALTHLAAHLTAHTGRDDLTIGTMIGDAGYDSDHNLTLNGPDRLIADSKRHHLDTRAAADPTTGEPPPQASPREQMSHQLRTPQGHTLYKRRAPMIEPPNSWLKDGRGLRRFSRRGLAAAQSELSLAAATTNLLKLFTKGITPAQLQASQPAPHP